MRDDLDTCIAFIREIEQHPILYNTHLQSYGDRRATESVWNEIGEKFNETGMECKNKWRTIRGNFVRNLNIRNKSGPKNTRKEYYLSPYLKFIEPFTKKSVEENPENYSVDANSVDDKVEYVDVQISEDQNLSLEETENDTEVDILHDERSLSSETDTALNQTTTNRNHRTKQEKIAEQPDPCEHFLLSLVPHMKSMTQREQLAFQRNVITLIEDTINAR